jgi:hypothetical protein
MDRYRYQQENADDAYYDRGELPPLADLPLPPGLVEWVRRGGGGKPGRRRGAEGGE